VRSIEPVAEDLRGYLLGWLEYFRPADIQKGFGKLSINRAFPIRYFDQLGVSRLAA
jgi:hypothetical protein